MKNEFSGKFIDWHLKLWGESIDADKATLLPMPSENDDNDHDVYQTTTVAASTTTVAGGSSPTKVQANPSDHPERPTKNPAKPSSTEASSPSGTNEAQEATSSASSNWVSWLPSFGASKKAQIWIYGAIGLIAAFCCGLGIYLWIARRRRLNNSRDNYEFELIDEEEAEGLNAGEKAARQRRKRGGELYDAFAEGSDDDEQFEGGYRDGRDGSSDRLPGDGAEQYVVGEESDDDDEKGESKPLSGRR